MLMTSRTFTADEYHLEPDTGKPNASLRYLSSQHASQLGEYLRHFGQQIVPVGTAELVYTRAVPAPVLIVVEDWRSGKLDRPHFGGEIGIEKEGEREAVAAGAVAHAMRRGTVQAAGHAIEHVSDVADEGVGHRRRIDP